jgi:hypothetical protein
MPNSTATFGSCPVYDSSGDWIAWRRTTDDRFLFDEDGDAIGWFPWGDADAVNMEGNTSAPS